MVSFLLQRQPEKKRNHTGKRTTTFRTVTIVPETRQTRSSSLGVTFQIRITAIAAVANRSNGNRKVRIRRILLEEFSDMASHFTRLVALNFPKHVTAENKGTFESDKERYHLNHRRTVLTNHPNVCH